ncbi:MAG: hypothetical protein CMN76_02165 [Spirochaetaceae bacterium]|nr:hypothetical protein [Spirochaetaceae bacterium]
MAKNAMRPVRHRNVGGNAISLIVGTGVSLWFFGLGWLMLYHATLQYLADPTKWHILVGVMIGGGLVVYTGDFLMGLFTTSNIIMRDAEGIEGKRIFRDWVRINYEEIVAVHKALALGGIVKVRSKDPKRSLEFGVGVVSGGDLMEAILANSPNLEKVDLKDWPNNRKWWQKEPDWDIINAAMARAEQNRRKKKAQEE